MRTRHELGQKGTPRPPRTPPLTRAHHRANTQHTAHKTQTNSHEHRHVLALELALVVAKHAARAHVEHHNRADGVDDDRRVDALVDLSHRRRHRPELAVGARQGEQALGHAQLDGLFFFFFVFFFFVFFVWLCVCY